MKTFVEKYVDYASKLTEAPRIFHYYMAYMMMSQVVGRKAICNYSDYGCGPNLWMVFIGASSTARKSSSWKIGIDILKEVNATDVIDPMIHSDGSYESWIEALSLRVDPKTGVAKGMMVFDEFKRLHDWITRDYSSPLETLFTSAYDQTEIRRRVGTRDKAQTYIIPSPYINIVAASTLTWFNKSVTPAQITSGFIPRFNIICSDDAGPLLPRRPVPDVSERAELIHDLKIIKDQDWGEFTYENSAGLIYDKFYCDMKRGKMMKASETMVPFYSRRLADVHKYAMMNCMMRHDTSRVMNKDDVESAIEEQIKNVLVFSESVIDDKMTYGPFQENRNHVMRLIKKYSGTNGGALHSMILRKSKLDKQTFDRVMATLSEEESIIVNREQTKGRTALFYKIRPEDGDDVSAQN